MDGIVEDNTAVSDEMTELLALIDEPATRQTTFINANKEEWDEVWQEISERFHDGMSAKHLRSLAERQESLHAFCAACNGDIRYGPAFHVDVISVDGTRTETLRLRRCESCPWKAASEPVDLVAYALWPVNARASAYLDFSYLLYIGVLQDLSPALSMGSILQALHLVSKLSCKNTFIMSQDAFNYSLFEWRSAYDQHISSLIDVFNCPCCGDSPHAIHLDGNAKLYRYRKAASATHQEPEKNALFLSQSIVEEQVTRVTASQEQPESKMCGDSIWKAASSVGRKFSKKDETGVMLATCRHSLVLKALDMVKGEIYAYPYTLQKCFPQAKYIAMDIMCRYSSWLQRVDPELAEKQKMFLSVMHAKAHNWNCQMNWSGRVTSGAGLSTGETTEQANSHLSRLGIVTRHMTRNGRRQRIKQAAGFWNLRKIIKLPKQLYTSIHKCKNHVMTLNRELIEERLQNQGVDMDDIITKLSQHKAGVRGILVQTVEHEPDCCLDKVPHLRRPADLLTAICQFC